MTTQECLGPEGNCHCVTSDLLERLGTKYAMDVLCVIASHDTVRFSTIEDHLPEASTSTLSARLDELEAAGLLTREHYDEVPPRVEYSLSDEGQDLGERLRPLFEWIAAREEDGGRGTDVQPGGHDDEREAGGGPPARGGPDR